MYGDQHWQIKIYITLYNKKEPEILQIFISNANGSALFNQMYNITFIIPPSDIV